MPYLYFYRYLNESCHEGGEEFALPVVEDSMSSQVATVNSPVALDCLSNETGVLPEFVAWVTPIHEIRVSSLRENQAGSCEPRHQFFEYPCVPEDEQLILSRVVYFSGGHDHIRVEGNRWETTDCDALVCSNLIHRHSMIFVIKDVNVFSLLRKKNSLCLQTRRRNLWTKRSGSLLILPVLLS